MVEQLFERAISFPVHSPIFKIVQSSDMILLEYLILQIEILFSTVTYIVENKFHRLGQWDRVSGTV